ncbi:hypothetical protein NHX12_001524 [Muraenolepis orangiensis]|uniref:Dysbindin n=1 Tax=Muraenolepis orangiensis TaxID=630683 RepID=A0A9Q0DYL7_9TELE|nr:hypothetical protein NHX12_001524 [Muraenolepis orangiensis]
MLGNFRERLQIVQQDLTTGLHEFPSQYTAGLELLSRYEESWVLLHRRTKDCAQNAEALDGDAVMLSAHWERRRTAMSQMQEQIQVLPDFIGQLETVTSRIAHLEGDFEEMESRLAYLESLCCQQELEALKEELDSDHARKVVELEQVTQNKLKERQKIHEDAFKHDMERYLSTGYLQLQAEAGRSQVCALDHLMVTDTSDQEALDDFLNSTANGASSMSSSLTSGPDLESWSSESLRVSASPANPANEQDNAFRHSEKLGSEDSDVPLVQSDEEDIPLVQSDEEDVQADALLAVLPEDGPQRSSDESDSAGDPTTG